MQELCREEDALRGALVFIQGMCILGRNHTHYLGALSMRTNIEIDDALMAEAQKASGQTTKKQTVEQALRLMIRLRRQQEVGQAFGKYRWRGDLGRSRRGRAGA